MKAFVSLLSLVLMLFPSCLQAAHIINTVAGSVVMIENLALTNGNEYRYQVEAVDGRGNKSGLSAPFSVIPIAGQEWGE